MANQQPHKPTDSSHGTTFSGIFGSESDVSLKPFNPHISEGQRAIAHIFFSLRESDGFIIAGGLSLIAQESSDRFTEDIDLFTHRRETVRDATHALITACKAQGIQAKLISEDYPDSTFFRIEFHYEGERVLADLALDSAPVLKPVQTQLGPVISEEESAGRKLCAVFGRTAPRDFHDLYPLAQKFGKQRSIDLAQQIDQGFIPRLVGRCMARINRIPDGEFPDPSTATELKEFFSKWAAELETTEHEAGQ